jgi:aspartyl-tRNA synthetase
MGWVDAIRDHGNLLFIHLRDVRGIVQVVFNPDTGAGIYQKAASLKEEYVVQIMGKVVLRDEGTENPNIQTGDIEVNAEDLTVFSKSKGLPFQISEKAMVFGEDIAGSPENVDEDLRIRYRYLDLRRPSVQNQFISRYEILKGVRSYLDEHHFIEIETPVLTKSTPEGARDYLVPSRVHRGKFYALPQSPQLFKQLLMMSGMDRYFQIVKCFRDEDLRPNRQPEFTQLDMEASFIDESFIYEIIEELTVRMFQAGGITLPRPFPRMTYEDAMARYGTDRPDLRFDMAFEDVTDLLRDTTYTVFRDIIQNGGRIKGFCIRGQADRLSKNVLQNEYALKIVPSLGAKGMTWMKVVDGAFQSNIVQFFTAQEQAALKQVFQAEEGDVLMMIADISLDLVNTVLSELRLHAAQRLGIISEDLYKPLWVTGFPLFECKEGGLSSQHHPFTMPDRTDFDPGDMESCLSLYSRAYDLVMNGEELGGGSIRIHDMETQKRIFAALGLTPEEADVKFGFFLKALEYGTPPHGGIALGIDRVISMILRTRSIRDVIAFPKNRRAFCPLTQAPSGADEDHLKDLGLIQDATAPIASAGIHAGTGEPAEPRDAGPSGAISISEVKHVAKLARLRLTDAEVESYRKDLNAVLGHFEKLQELDTRNTTPMSHVLDMKNVWRKDEIVDTEATDALLSNAPDKEKGHYKVPRILEG